MRSYASRYRSAVASTTCSGNAGGGGSWSQPVASSQSRTYCLSNDGWGRPGSYPSIGQSREESGVPIASPPQMVGNEALAITAQMPTGIPIATVGVDALFDPQRFLVNLGPLFDRLEALEVAP